ncbi:hypothetical protein CYMTET_6674 [Cymbomonas tetramitiformis]|uniref:Uncharacterized protein n=1 Tax=Cymbomonas tetramitiformis TaxID=36881 RepID=A0AAE0GX47_9CHLO|nr:hypothetical protein CYMTET_6674 [Cymbomonas tetramitiformis]
MRAAAAQRSSEPGLRHGVCSGGPTAKLQSAGAGQPEGGSETLEAAMGNVAQPAARAAMCSRQQLSEQQDACNAQCNKAAYRSRQAQRPTA